MNGTEAPLPTSEPIFEDICDARATSTGKGACSSAVEQPRYRLQ
jgi:hypothetical protein